jgi:hypothetical protein
MLIFMFLFIALSRETDFGFALSAQLTTIGFSPSWRLRDACLCFFVLTQLLGSSRIRNRYRYRDRNGSGNVRLTPIVDSDFDPDPDFGPQLS